MAQQPPTGLFAVMAGALLWLLLLVASAQGQAPQPAIRATLQFRFFYGVPIPTFSVAEIDSFLCQTNHYLSSLDPDFSCACRDVTWDLWTEGDNNDQPVVGVNFTVQVTHDNVPQVNNLDPILSRFSPFDPNEFITKYVWLSEPYKKSFFFDVSKMKYDFSVADPPAPETVMLTEATNCTQEQSNATTQSNLTTDNNLTDSNSSWVGGNITTTDTTSSPTILVDNTTAPTSSPHSNIFNSPNMSNDTLQPTTTATPTAPPLPSNIVEIPVNFTIFNTQGITNPPQVNASGISQSFHNMVKQIFVNHSHDYDNTSTTTLVLGDIYIDDIERISCWPNDTSSDNVLTICHQVLARYRLVLPENEESNATFVEQLRQDFIALTDAAINTQGRYQSLLEQEYPASPLHIGLPLAPHPDDYSTNNIVVVHVEFLISNIDLVVDQESLVRGSGLEESLLVWMQQLIMNGPTSTTNTTGTSGSIATPTSSTSDTIDSSNATAGEPAAVVGVEPGGLLGSLNLGHQRRVAGYDEGSSSMFQNVALGQVDMGDVVRVYCGLQAHPDAACFLLPVAVYLNVTTEGQGPYATVETDKVSNEFHDLTMAAMEDDDSFQNFLWQEVPKGFPRLYIGRRNILKAPVPPPDVMVNNETSTATTTTFAPTPPRVVSVETELLVSNRANITDPVQVNNSGLGESFPAFVHELVVNISSELVFQLQQPRGRRSGRNLRLQQHSIVASISLHPLSANVDHIVPADCGESGKDWSCHQAFVSYELDVRSDEDLEDVRARYRKSTDDSIQNGSYQYVLSREVADSPLKIGLPDGTTKANETESPPSSPSADGGLNIPIDVIFNTSNWKFIVDPDEVLVDNSLLKSWDVFVREMAANVSAALEGTESMTGAPFKPVNMDIDSLYGIPCGPDANADMTCHQAHASYELEAAPTASSPDIPRQEVRDLYLNETIRAIRNGTYQSILRRDFPDSDILIGIAIDSPQQSRPMDWWLIVLIVWLIICCNLMICAAYFLLCRTKKDKDGPLEESDVEEPASSCVPENVVISRTDLNDESVSWESADDEPTSDHLVLRSTRRPETHDHFPSNSRTNDDPDNREVLATRRTRCQSYNNYSVSNSASSSVKLLPAPAPTSGRRRKRRKRPKNADNNDQASTNNNGLSSHDARETTFETN